MNEGIIKIFQALTSAKSIEELLIADCQWWEDEDVMAAMRKAMTTNTKLGKYEMQHNTNSESFIEELCEILEEAKHISYIGMSHRSEEL